MIYWCIFSAKHFKTCYVDYSNESYSYIHIAKKEYNCFSRDMAQLPPKPAKRWCVYIRTIHLYVEEEFLFLRIFESLFFLFLFSCVGIAKKSTILISNYNDVVPIRRDAFRYNYLWKIYGAVKIKIFHSNFAAIYHFPAKC